MSAKRLDYQAIVRSEIVGRLHMGVVTWGMGKDAAKAWAEVAIAQLREMGYSVKRKASK